MIRLRHKMLIQLTVILDQVVLSLAALGAINIRSKLPTTYPQLYGSHRIIDALAILTLVTGWIWIFNHFVSYKASRLIGLSQELLSIFKATTLSAAWLLIIGSIFSYQHVDPFAIGLFWTLITSIGVISRIALRGVVLLARSTGYNHRYFLMVGTSERAAEFARKLQERPELGYKLVGFISESEPSKRTSLGYDEAIVIGNLSDVRELLKNERVDEIIVCLSDETKLNTFKKLIFDARDLGIVLRIIPDSNTGPLLQKVNLEEFNTNFVITFFREKMLLQLLIKRFLDIAISSTLLIMLLPTFVFVSIAIRVTSPGPILFTQERVGMNQRRFRLYKFRSMVSNADDLKEGLRHLNERDGPAFKINKDPRITRVGQYIRKTSIDELPQLYNVIKGEMSLVGPRPPLPNEVRQYQWLHRRRLSVKPGITCLWQISNRSKTTFDEWMKMDNQYIENWSLLLDLKILLRTIPAVILCRDAA